MLKPLMHLAAARIGNDVNPMRERQCNRIDNDKANALP
jgi:hypothetical protein